MRIAYLTGTYPAVSHTFVAREVDDLRALGVEVETFSLRPAETEHLLTEADRRAAETTTTLQPPRWGRLLGAHVRGLARHPLGYLRAFAVAQRLSPPGLRMRLWSLFYFAEAILLWRHLRSRDISHVHVHFANAASMVALLYAEFAAAEGAGFSFTMHGPTEFDEVERFRLREKVAAARFVACISDYARAQLMRFSPPEDWERLHVVRCGVDTRFGRPSRSTAPRNGIRLLTVARLAPDKGVEILIRALAETADDEAEVSVEIVGDGPDRSALENLAAELGVDDRIEFSGYVGQDRIREHYEAADAFCLPSFAEGIPVVLMEAMALEMPVIAPRVMGIPELVEHGKSGLLVPPGRIDALAAAILRLARDRGGGTRGDGQGGEAKRDGSP